MNGQICDSPFYKSGKFAGMNLHLGVTGSVACYKAADLLRAWRLLGMNVSVTLSSGARQFVSPVLFSALGGKPVYDEMFADSQNVFGHLEPGQNARALVVAPASADALAKLACGFADEMLFAQAAAFSGPLVVAPAMNPRMWANPATRANIRILEERGCLVAQPGIGNTACGEEGRGRLAPLPEIFLFVLRALAPQDMTGRRVMVTLGPTREPWDGVRFWSNPSSGRMGCALAACAWLRGASVTAICGPGIESYLPEGITRINVTAAREMFEAASGVWPQMDFGLFSAAVSDFAPARPADGDGFKFKKNLAASGLEIKFDRNPDILDTLARKRRPDQKVLGFAAEIAPDMQSLLSLAQLKLRGKQADIIAANRVNHGDSAFGADECRMAVVDKNGHEEIWEPQSKADIAWELCSWLLKI